MMKNLILFLMLMSGLFLVTSCGEDDPIVTNDIYSNGTFVINQGSFGSGTGTISFLSNNDNSITSNIYQDANDGLVLGNVAQSMQRVGDHFLVTVNNAQKVEIIKAEDFTYANTIDGIAQARYVLDLGNNEALISTWGATGTDGKIFKVNTSTATIVSSLDVAGGPEKMLKVGNDVFVTNSGGFFRDSIVYQLNAAGNSISSEIVVGDNPSDLVVDSNGDLWVLCNGYTNFSDPTLSTNGSLVQIRNGAVVKELEIGNGSSQLEISNDGSSLFYLNGGKVYQQNIADNTVSGTVIYEGFFYGMGINPDNDNIYLTDAKDFVSNGDVVIITQNGDLVETIEAGIIPGELHFED